jgi:hypothetical protein
VLYHGRYGLSLIGLLENKFNFISLPFEKIARMTPSYPTNNAAHLPGVGFPVVLVVS